MQNKLIRQLDDQFRFWRHWASRDRRFSIDEEERRLEAFTKFLHEAPNAADRHNLPGHLTGSALVVDPSMQSVVLTHHRKLNQWLQLGGHADGEWDMGNVARREVIEESGIVRLWQCVLRNSSGHFESLPFDIDCHTIPANAKDPAHLHYDVRFLVITESAAAISVSEESHDVKWFSLSDARQLTQDASLHRQLDKAEFLRNRTDVWKTADFLAPSPP